jgi:capsular polysaccharide transport system permease protein
VNLLRGIGTQATVIWALMMRETRTRFGSHRLGYLWALAEPGIAILTFVFIFDLLHRHTPYDMDIYGFLVTGFTSYNVCVGTMHNVANSIAGNRAMLYYPHVQPVDIVIARGILETATGIVVFLVLMLIRSLAIHDFTVDEPLLLVEAFVLAGLLGTTFGMVWCVLGQFSPIADRARGHITRPLFWISGLFFCVNELPQGFHDFVLWNPVIHVSELMRDGWYGSYTAHTVDIPYVLSFVLVAAFIGLSLERIVRRRIEVT